MYTLDWKMREPRAYLNYFDVPSNGNVTFDRRYYSYDYGDVHYVVLDTQLYESNHEDNHDTHHPDLYDVQVQWLRQDLASNPLIYIPIVIGAMYGILTAMHQGLYTFLPV